MQIDTTTRLFFKGLKLALWAFIVLFVLLVIFLGVGLFGYLPPAVEPDYDRTLKLIETIQGPIAFVITILTAAFGLLGLILKAQKLTSFNQAVVQVLFEGYKKNFLAPVRAIAEIKNYPVVIAKPLYSLLKEQLYVKHILECVKEKGYKVEEVMSGEPRSYFLVSKSTGKVNKSVIFDSPTTLVTISKMIDINFKVKDDDKTSKKAKEMFRVRREDFFKAMDEWSNEEDCSAVFSHICSEDKDGFRGVANAFDKHFQVILKRAK